MPTTETVRTFWENRVDATPAAPFLLAGDLRATYAEFDASLNRLANGLRIAGVELGDHVAYHLPNGLALLRLEMAAQKLGAVTVPVIPGSTHAEMSYVLGHAEPKFLVLDEPGAQTLREGGVPGDARTVVVPEGGGSLGELESDDAFRPSLTIDPQDAMSIRYTSGSTGRPKGVVQPSSGFSAAGYAIAERLGLETSDNVFSAMPLFHTAATHMMLAPAIAAGCRFTLVPQFSRATFWDEVRRVAGTVALLMPTQLSILMTAPPDPRDGDNPMRIMFSHVRSEELCRRFEVDVCTTWAMTETSGMGTLTVPGLGHYEPKLIGRPMPDDAEIRIVGPDGQPLEPGEPGELCFRHPHVMTEYYRDEANTASTLQDGWVHSGDLCTMDTESNAYFHGRLKNVIKRGGENIAGEEVEFTIMEHPDVEECLVCAVEDPIYTEEVCAVVVSRGGHTINEPDVTQWCAQRLSAWKVPRYVQVRDERLPKLANGKTDRGAVAADVVGGIEKIWDRLRAEGQRRG